MSNFDDVISWSNEYNVMAKCLHHKVPYNAAFQQSGVGMGLSKEGILGS